MALKKDQIIKIHYGLVRSSYDSQYVEHLNVARQISQETEVKNAYIVVANQEGTKERVSYTLNVYTDNTKQVLIDSISFAFQPSVDDDAPNIIKQCYEHAKNEPEFIGAVDC